MRLGGESRNDYRARSRFDPGQESAPTDWASVFKPRLGALTQSSDLPNFQGPTAGGAPIGVPTGNALNSAILGARQGRQGAVIAANPLWKSFQQGQPGPGAFAGVTDKSAQPSMFGGVSDIAADEQFGGGTNPAPTLMDQPIAAASAPGTNKNFTPQAKSPNDMATPSWNRTGWNNPANPDALAAIRKKYGTPQGNYAMGGVRTRW